MYLQDFTDVKVRHYLGLGANSSQFVFSKRQRITLRLLYAIGRPSVVCLSVCLSVCRLSSVCRL